MCLFKYKEKRYGKLTLRLAGLFAIALGVASGFGAVYAFNRVEHWSKYVILGVASLVAVGLFVLGCAMVFITFSMINSSKSVRDGNKAKGISNVRLCDKCGRVISKNAEFCEHCGSKQLTGLGMKICPKCKTKNSATAQFCEKCQHEFKD